jgi:hypothetical protein
LKRNERYQVAATTSQIIEIVKKLREDLKDKWPLPNHSQSLLWAISELGEFSEVMVHDQEKWIRNNPEKQYDSPEKEFAQLLIMLATAAYQDFEKEERGYNDALFLYSIILDSDYLTRINVPVELLFRAVKYSKRHYDWDLVEIVQTECDRMREKHK